MSAVIGQRLKPSRGRQYVVPVALLSTTVAGGLLIRDAGASELSPEAAAMKNVSNTVAGLGLDSRPRGRRRSDRSPRRRTLVA